MAEFVRNIELESAFTLPNILCRLRFELQERSDQVFAGMLKKIWTNIYRVYGCVCL